MLFICAIVPYTIYSFCYSLQYAAYSDSLVTLSLLSVNRNDLQRFAVICNDPAIHLSWQLLFILPMIADSQLVCGAAWDFTPSSVQAPQYWSSRRPDGPDPNNM